MSDIYTKIKNGIQLLNSKDRKYAEKFLSERDFEKLYELVKANVIVLQNKSDTNAAFVNLVKIIELKNEIMQYLEILGIPIEEDEEDTDEITDDEFEDNLYDDIDDF